MTLLCHCPEARLVADEGRVRHVLEQLLDNAAKFTPAGSPITVSVDLRDDRLELRVVDRGTAIAESERERIFDRFVQGGDILTDKPAGVGLGLAIARETALAHGGTLHCERDADGGNAFVLRLPVRLEAVPGPAAVSADGRGSP